MFDNALAIVVPVYYELATTGEGEGSGPNVGPLNEQQTGDRSAGVYPRSGQL